MQMFKNNVSDPQIDFRDETNNFDRANQLCISIYMRYQKF